MFDESPIDYVEVLAALDAHLGEDVLVLVTGRSEDATPLLRLRGPIGRVDPLTEGLVSNDETVEVASFGVGDALFCLSGPEFVDASRIGDQDWLVIRLEHVELEVRFAGPAE
jgi:hypothetical protein